jgi:hypothetical protein
MNDRKRAWQILHIEIRRRANPNPDTDDEMSTWSTQVGTIIREADDLSDLIIELAGFGATYALMPRTGNDPLGVADHIGGRVIQEPDDRGDDEP